MRIFSNRTFTTLLFATVLQLAGTVSRAEFAAYADLTVAGYEAERPALENFPVLVRISESGIPGFAYSLLQADGKDLAFTSIDGAATYPHEIDTWNPAGESLVWVLLPTMENGTTFRMHFGDESIAAAPDYTTSGQLWIDAGYIGVWHLGEPDPADWVVGTEVPGVTGYSRDSSAHALHGTNNVYTSHCSDGAIGSARYMATDDAVSRTKGGVIVPGWSAFMAQEGNFSSTFTASVWIRRKGLALKDAVAYETMLSTKEALSAKTDGWGFGLTTSYGTLLVYGTGSANKKVTPVPGEKQGGDWQKYDLVYTATRDVYTNGAPQSVGVFGANNATNSDLPLGIGTNPDATNSWLGDLDEVRISAVVRTEDWIAADYATVKDSAFLSFGAVVSDLASLSIAGDPSNIGTADPAYGTVTAISAGDSFTASVTATNLMESGVERWICTGYTHSEILDSTTGEKSVVQQGDTNAFAYNHVRQDELIWHFTNEWLVSATATVGGSVSAGEAGTWVRNGETTTLIATPESGYEFWQWIGDVDGITDISETSVAPVVTSARTLKAVFVLAGADATVQYVATDGDDANSGFFKESPKRTIQAAVDTLAESTGYGTVYVAPGTYPASISESVLLGDKIYANIVVTNGISVLGETGKPEDVVVCNTSTQNNDHAIVFYLNHPKAFVANLTVTGGHRSAMSSPYGANVAIDAAGGSVSNCVLRDSITIGNYVRGSAAWLNSDDALLTHCVVTNNSVAGGTYQISGVYGGMFVHVEKGIVDNCLIANNRDSSKGTASVQQDKQSWACAVTITNGKILNSTVAMNEAPYTAGVYLHPNALAMNVVVAGGVNTCLYLNEEGNPPWSDIGFKGSLDNALHCASDGGEALDATCVAGTAMQFFRDPDALDFRPSMDSPLVDKGTAYAEISDFDLEGNRRVQGLPDIGCYENPPRCGLIFVR